jgi:hypothetical protein
MGSGAKNRRGCSELAPGQRNGSQSVAGFDFYLLLNI